MGQSGDISFANNANTTKDSISYLGCAYSHPQYMQKEQMKLNHLWPDRIRLNWMKLKFIKRKNKEEEINIKLNLIFLITLLDIEFIHFFK